MCSGASLRSTRGRIFFPGLDQSFGPARLLRFERGHLDRQFCRTFDILQIDELPAFELRAIGKVGVFGERVVLPAAGFVDRCRRQTPAVPLKLKKTPLRARPECSSTKWPSSRMASTCVRKE